MVEGQGEEQAEEEVGRWRRGERKVGNLLPSSASSSSGTPVSWHFLLWAFDFMCLVRFPGKEREQTQAWLEGRGQGRPRAGRGSTWLAGRGFSDWLRPSSFEGWAGACARLDVRPQPPFKAAYRSGGCEGTQGMMRK